MVGMYKLNTDAALDVRGNVVGVGLVIWDRVGRVMATSAQRVVASFTPPVAEASTVLRGLQLAVDASLLPIEIESDALEVVTIRPSRDLAF